MARRKILFQVADPFGNAVHLEEATFRGHIVTGHPEMIDALERIAATVTSPYRVRRSTILPAIAAAFERNFGSRWYRVLVEYEDDSYLRGRSRGMVMTAYMVDATIKAQVGKVIYQKGSQTP